MRLIKSKAELLTQSEGLRGIYQMIELAGRTCYKSEANITHDSASEFVGKMIKSGHTAMLEHGTVYLSAPYDTVAVKYRCNKYSEVVDVANSYSAITTNYRVIVENGWLDDLKYLCEPTEHHRKRISMRFTTDRGVSHEIVRHRVFSFAQESTRQWRR